MRSKQTFIGLAEVASELGASRSAVRGWLESAGVEAFCFGSGKNSKLSYRRSDIDDWVQECGADFEDDDEDEAEDSEEDGDDGDEEAEDSEEEGEPSACAAGPDTDTGDDSEEEGDDDEADEADEDDLDDADEDDLDDADEDDLDDE